MTYSRKLQRIGKSIFVSLPKTWVERTQFDKGDTVELVEQPDGSIAVYPEFMEETVEQTTLNVDLNESKRSLRRRITGVYVDGFDVIRLKAADKFSDDQQDAIREITETLFGLEIVEVTSNLITIQCLLTKTLPVEKTIQRIHSITNSILSETCSALKETDPKATRSTIKRVIDVERLSLVVHRLLRSQLLFPTKRASEIRPIDSVDFLRVLDKIIEVSGSVKKITESVSKILERPPSNFILEPLLNICDKILDIYNWSIQALISKDVASANRVLDEKMNFDNLWILLMEAEEKTQISIPTFSHTHRIIDNLKQIRIYSRDIAEIAIDRAEEISGENVL